MSENEDRMKVYWVTKELKSIINKKKQTFYSGDPLKKKAVSREVNKEIRKAKIQYRRKIENQYTGEDLSTAWQGIKSMAAINQHTNDTRQPARITGVDDVDLPDAFNLFFSRFECPLSDDFPKLRESLSSRNDIEISQELVIVLFKKTKIGKAAGLDTICGRILRHCADQLGEIFSTLSQMCANSCQIPNVQKKSIIIPILKSKNPKELNEYRPIALTSLVIESFEKILKDEIISLTLDKLDPLQFAYQSGKGVEDAKLFILDRVYKHLEQPKSHARLLFADFSSAFNKMQPNILTERLASHLMLPD